MRKTILTIAMVFAAILGAASSASAQFYTYVGSWQVDQGANWQTVPLQYSGQSAAAWIFGGVASGYAISTIDDNAANVNHMAWYSTWGGACSGPFPCGTQYAEGLTNGTLYKHWGDISAYTEDWARGAHYTNYAFLVTVTPEPASAGLMALGLGLVGFGLKRTRRS
jgi:hypothetical protein